MVQTPDFLRGIQVVRTGHRGVTPVMLFMSQDEYGGGGRRSNVCAMKVAASHIGKGEARKER